MILNFFVEVATFSKSDLGHPNFAHRETFPAQIAPLTLIKIFFFKFKIQILFIVE